MLQKGRVFLWRPQQDTNIVLFLRLKNLGGSSACGAARGGGDETSKTDGELFDTEKNIQGYLKVPKYQQRYLFSTSVPIARIPKSN